jgi:hypothetical protein
VDDVLKLSRAQVGEDVTISYIQNSGIAYNLGPNDIVYLKNQGVSDRVVNAMLDERKRVIAQSAAAHSSSFPSMEGAAWRRATSPSFRAWEDLMMDSFSVSAWAMTASRLAAAWRSWVGLALVLAAAEMLLRPSEGVRRVDLVMPVVGDRHPSVARD